MKKKNLFSALKKTTSIVLAAAAMLSILTLIGCSNSTTPIISNISPDSSTASKNPKKRNIKKPEDITEDDFNDFYQVAVNKLDERIKGLLDENEPERDIDYMVSKSDIFYPVANIEKTDLFQDTKIKMLSIKNANLLSAYIFSDMNSDLNHVHTGFHCDKYFIVLLFSADISAERTREGKVIQSGEGQYVFSVYFGMPNYVDDELHYNALPRTQEIIVTTGGVSEEAALEKWLDEIKYDNKCQYTHTKIK